MTTTNELDELRKRIDEIDEKTAKLFEERMNAVREISAYKRARGIAVLDEKRESAVIKKNAAHIADKEIREYYPPFISAVMKLSRDLQIRQTEGLRVSYGGTEGSFGYSAAKKAFPNAKLFAAPSFEQAYKGVENGEYDCAVLPVENSYAGDVSTVTDLAFSGNLYVNAVIETPIEQHLLMKKGAKIDEISTVISHPQALSQCSEFLNKKGSKTEEFSNTALAAQYVAESDDTTLAAIASADCAERFGLEIAERAINSSKNNTTRFAVFSRTQNLPSPDETNENLHFILVFTAKNEAGSLAQALNVIGAHDFNLRTLVSRPMKTLLWNYYFYVEADGNIATENGRAMLQELSAVCSQLKLLGAYD